MNEVQQYLSHLELQLKKHIANDNSEMIYFTKGRIQEFKKIQKIWFQK